MKAVAVWIGGVLALAALVLAPFYLEAYGLGLLIGLAGYVTLATAWSLLPTSTNNRPSGVKKLAAPIIMRSTNARPLSSARSALAGS